MTLRCPHCHRSVGGQAPQGGLAVRGIAITLVKSDGTVYGPCKFCRGEVVLVEGGALSKSAEAALAPRSRSRRVVFVIDEDDG